MAGVQSLSRELPSWQACAAGDRAAQRAWKKAIRAAGKRRCFEALAPVLRLQARRVRNRPQPAYCSIQSPSATDQRMVLIAAFDELHAGHAGEAAAQIMA